MNMYADCLNLIAGEHRPGRSNAWFDKLEPATGALLARVAASTPADVDAAVGAARSQFDGGAWAALSGAARARLIHRLADLLEARTDHFAELLAREQGRAIMEMRMLDIPMAVDTLRYFAGWADKLEGRQIPTPGFMGRPTFNYTVREAVGVAVLIVPWNAPLMIGAWKLGPALAAGCTVVIKPSEDAPLALTALAALCLEAGFPAGVVNVVQGRGAEVGRALVTHPGVDKISFTGSTVVGRDIAAAAGPLFKRLTLELGGKAPQIVLPDAPLEQAIAGCAMGLFVDQGQTCAAGSRILVHRSLHDTLCQALTGAANSLSLGDPLAAGTQMGALISARHAERVRAHITRAVAQGATLETCEGPLPDQGFFVRPAILSGVTPDMDIAREEVFGPVGAIIPFDTEEEAIQLANDCAYGLSATLWTQNLTRAHQMAARLRVGAVAINGWSPLDARLPWGGIKDSGTGNDLSRSALDAYLSEKLITLVM
jgi:phenylacetaldehyde dehydrogenase